MKSIEKRFKRVETHLLRTNEQVFKLGKRAELADSAGEITLNSHLNAQSSLTVLVAEIKERMSFLSQKEEKSQALASDSEKDLGFSLSGIGEALEVKKLRWFDVVSGSLLLVEGVIGYQLFMEYLGDETLANIALALSIALITAFVGWIIKKSLKKLPDFFFYIYLTIFMVTTVVFVFQLADLRSVQSFSEFLNVANNPASTMNENSNEESVWFTVSKLGMLFFGGAVLSAFFRKPSEEREADKLTNLYGETNNLNKELSKLSNLDKRADGLLKELNSKNETEVYLKGIRNYLDGLEKASPLFSMNSSGARQNRRIEAHNLIKKLKASSIPNKTKPKKGLDAYEGLKYRATKGSSVNDIPPIFGK